MDAAPGTSSTPFRSNACRWAPRLHNEAPPRRPRERTGPLQNPQDARIARRNASCWRRMSGRCRARCQSASCASRRRPPGSNTKDTAQCRFAQIVKSPGSGGEGASLWSVVCVSGPRRVWQTGQVRARAGLSMGKPSPLGARLSTADRRTDPRQTRPRSTNSKARSLLPGSRRGLFVCAVCGVSCLPSRKS